MGEPDGTMEGISGPGGGPAAGDAPGADNAPAVGDTSGERMTPVTNLSGGEWILTGSSSDASPDASRPSGTSGPAEASDVVLTIVFDPVHPSDGPSSPAETVGSVSGSSGCNTFRASFRAGGDDQDALSFGPIASTRMSCGPEMMETESWFLSALARVEHVRIMDRHLVLIGKDVELVFARRSHGSEDVAAPTGVVEETGERTPSGEWTIINYRSAVSVRSPVPGTRPTILLGEDGAVSVRTGCNTVISTISYDDDRVSFTAPIQTLKACAEPEGVMAQEADLARSLLATTHLRVGADRLDMLDDEDHTMITAVRWSG